MDRKGTEGKRSEKPIVDNSPTEKDWPAIFGSEWPWVKKLGAAISDPEEKRTFWESIKNRKLANPRYSVYQDFPRSESATAAAREECCEFVRSLSRAGVKKENSA